MKKTISIMLTVLIVMVMLATTVVSGSALTKEERLSDMLWLGEISEEEYLAQVSPSYENEPALTSEQNITPLGATAKTDDTTDDKAVSQATLPTIPTRLSKMTQTISSQTTLCLIRQMTTIRRLAIPTR